MKNGYLTREWFDMNKSYKSGDYNTDELELKSSELIDKLADLTTAGVKEIDNVSIDTWKDRLWNLVENIGRLPEYKEEDGNNYPHGIIDEWYSNEEN